MVGNRVPAARRLGVVAAAMLAAVVALSGCWTQVGFGPERQRYNPLEQTITAGNVTALAEAWAQEHTGDISEPIVAGGRVFVTRSDPGTRTVSLHAVRAGTGAELWQRTLVTSSDAPWLRNPVVYAHGELWASYAAPNGVALLRLDPATGATIANVSGDIVGTQVVVAGEIVAYSDLEGLVVRDRASGALLWRFRPGEPGSIPSGRRLVAVDRGRIYASFGRELYAFAAAGCGATTCPPLWQHTDAAAPDINGLAVGPDGQVITTTAFRWVEDHRGQRVPGPSRLTAHEGDTGGLRWAASVTSATGGLAVDADTVYVTTGQVADASGPGMLGSHRVVALPAARCRAPCGPLWQTDPLPATPTEPLVGGGVVYTGVAGDVQAYDAAGCGAMTCGPIASIPGAGEPRSLAHGQLYVTSPAGDGTRLAALAPR